jgi:hypothetical protein
MRSRSLFPLALVALALLLAAAPALAHEGVAASPAEQQRIHLDLAANADINAGWECTEWHELYPDECVVRHLDRIGGTGKLEACNPIWFDGVKYHIDWVGPTYFLDCLVAEPSTINEDGDPVGETWHEIKPNYCDEHEVVGWEDADASGDVSECDIIIFGNGEVCHVYRVSLDIIISPWVGTADPDATEP